VHVSALVIGTSTTEPLTALSLPLHAIYLVWSQAYAAPIKWLALGIYLHDFKTDHLGRFNPMGMSGTRRCHAFKDAKGRTCGPFLCWADAVVGRCQALIATDQLERAVMTSNAEMQEVMTRVNALA
jgi:hypothetical protein